MIVEVWSLIVVWALLMLVTGAQGVMTPILHGLGYGLSSRDEARPRSVLAARIDRTAANQMEASITFALLMLAAFMTSAWGPLTEIGAALFAGSRIVFVIVYVLGIPVIRSVVFGVGLVGLGAILVGVVQSIT